MRLKITEAQISYMQSLHENKAQAEKIIQQTNPKGIVSSRDGNTRNEAFKLYRYYYQGLNSSVKVTKLTPLDKYWKDCSSDRDSNKGLKCNSEGEASDKEFLQLYNSILYMPPTEYKPLIQRGNSIMDEFKGLKNTLIVSATAFFTKKYFS